MQEIAADLEEQRKKEEEKEQKRKEKEQKRQEDLKKASVSATAALDHLTGKK